MEVLQEPVGRGREAAGCRQGTEQPWHQNCLALHGNRERLSNRGPKQWFFTWHSPYHHREALNNMVQHARVGRMDWDLKQVLRHRKCAVKN